MGVDFTIVEGKGPKIIDPIRDESSAAKVKTLYDVETQVPFLGPILKVWKLFIFLIQFFFLCYISLLIF